MYYVHLKYLYIYTKYKDFVKKLRCVFALIVIDYSFKNKELEVEINSMHINKYWC